MSLMMHPVEAVSVVAAYLRIFMYHHLANEKAVGIVNWLKWGKEIQLKVESTTNETLIKY